MGDGVCECGWVDVCGGIGCGYVRLDSSLEACVLL